MRFLAIFCVVFGMQAGFAADHRVVQIADPALERAIRENLDILDRPLTKGDLASITTLRAVGKGISDLSGIEHASKLTA